MSIPNLFYFIKPEDLTSLINELEKKEPIEILTKYSVPCDIAYNYTYFTLDYFNFLLQPFQLALKDKNIEFIGESFMDGLPDYIKKFTKEWELLDVVTPERAKNIQKSTKDLSIEDVITKEEILQNKYLSGQSRYTNPEGIEEFYKDLTVTYQLVKKLIDYSVKNSLTLLMLNWT